MKKDAPPPSGQSGKSRKPYGKPELIDYGSIEKLTQSGGATHHDGAGTKKVGA